MEPQDSMYSCQLPHTSDRAVQPHRKVRMLWHTAQGQRPKMCCALGLKGHTTNQSHNGTQSLPVLVGPPQVYSASPTHLEVYRTYLALRQWR